MDNEKRQRLEETLTRFEKDILDKMSKHLSDTEKRTHQQFEELHQRLDGIEQMIRELNTKRD